MRHYLIGCGGVGSWVLPKLLRIAGEDEVILVDGDTFEEKNLDRQLFSQDAIGLNKAQAMVGTNSVQGFNAKMNFIPRYYSSGAVRHQADDLLWCCADNHACRREVLMSCDERGCSALFGANEYVDWEAYYYQPSMRGTPNDPRVFYPIIQTDRSNDPLGPPGCVELSEGNRQLVLSNASAADAMLWLYWFWFHERQGDEGKEYFPVAHRGSPNTMRTTKFSERGAL